MEGSVIPVFMPMIQFGSDVKNVYKTVENSNSSVEKVDGATKRIDNGLRKSYISSTGDRFLDKHKKLVQQPCQEFLDVEINSKDMILTFLREKKKTIVEQCQFLLRKPLVTFRELSLVIFEQLGQLLSRKENRVSGDFNSKGVYKCFRSD